jgi:hypothetical protein
MNTDKKVFNKLFSTEKVELASEKFEFGVVQDLIKIRQDASDSFNAGFDLVANAKAKSTPLIKNTISLTNNFLSKLSETKKIADNLGIEMPKEFAGEEKRANELLAEAKTALAILDKLSF